MKPPAAKTINQKPHVTFDDVDNVVDLEPEPTFCPGITLSYIQDMKLDADKRAKRMLGFKQTVREGWQTWERLEHPVNNIGFHWPFSLPVVSALTSSNDVSKIVWKIEQIDCRTNNNIPGPDFEKFVICHSDCDPSATVELKQGLCLHCIQKKKLLMQRFDSNIDKRNTQIHANTRNDMLRTSSLQQEKTKHWMRMAKNFSQKLSYQQRVMDCLVEETGIDVQVNSEASKIFSRRQMQIT